MPKWVITPEWKDQDAIIIGGGSSLEGFDFTKLKGRNTIGCNDAFRLGPQLVKLCVFGDTSWFRANRYELQTSGVRCATCAPALAHDMAPWLLQIKRERTGLHDPPAVGWNYSTGALAVNVAVQLGANRIFLLGFDMGRRHDGKTHWHNHCNRQIRDEAYRRFLLGFSNLNKGLARYPHVKVYNVTDGGSRLSFFTKIGLEQFLQEACNGTH